MTQWWKKINARERALLLFLVIAILAAGYLTLRVKSMQSEGKRMNEILAETMKERNSLRPIRTGAQNMEAMEKEIAELTRGIEETDRLLEGFSKGLIDLLSSDALANAKGEITILAEKNNMKVLQINRSSLRIDSLTGTKKAGNQIVHERPLFDLKLQGAFISVNEFIRQLAVLPFNAVIMRLQIQAVKATPSGTSRYIEAMLTVSL
ncbi:MAG: hypothetical protein ISR96_02140 [Nitrospira sp.]|nr:hypothetical protein [bacterium]MBL7048317.1 hypothetical protein [Nitrospira sp.]